MAESNKKNVRACPDCNGSLQLLGGGQVFCLDCDWDNIGNLPQTKRPRRTIYFTWKGAFRAKNGDPGFYFWFFWVQWDQQQDDYGKIIPRGYRFSHSPIITPTYWYCPKIVYPFLKAWWVFRKCAWDTYIINLNPYHDRKAKTHDICI